MASAPRRAYWRAQGGKAHSKQMRGPAPGPPLANTRRPPPRPQSGGAAPGGASEENARLREDDQVDGDGDRPGGGEMVADEVPVPDLFEGQVAVAVVALHQCPPEPAGREEAGPRRRRRPGGEERGHDPAQRPDEGPSKFRPPPGSLA